MSSGGDVISLYRDFISFDGDVMLLIVPYQELHMRAESTVSLTTTSRLRDLRCPYCPARYCESGYVTRHIWNKHDPEYEPPPKPTTATTTTAVKLDQANDDLPSTSMLPLREADEVLKSPESNRSVPIPSPATSPLDLLVSPTGSVNLLGMNGHFI